MFEGILPSTVPGVANRSDARYETSEADVRYWAFGVGIKLAPEVRPAGPGGAADLLIRVVRATAGATINGENIRCDEVFKQ
jgi:hypothetical protein